MKIHGLQKMTLLDYPGHVACTVFLGGCDFRCPFCHNGSLVLAPASAEQIPEEKLLEFLKKRQGVLDGVCITGGEPLLQRSLPALLGKIRALGYSIKLDTNGSYPQRLREIAESGLIDYVAMDIKNAPEKYPVTVGVNPLDLSPIFESVDYLKGAGIDHEFRTTVVKGLHTAQDFEIIADWLEGEKNYFLQNFVDSGDLISPGFDAFKPEEMRGFLRIVQKKIPTAGLRGLSA